MELINRTIVNVVERGWLPDSITRWLVRRLCQKRLDQLKQQNVTATQFAREMRSAPVAPVPEKANEQHYELPSAFFEQMLGTRLKYSCCFFEDDTVTIDEAEIAALSLTCRRAQIADGMNILELGCGWGSLTLWMLENYPAVTVTAVSNSATQREKILEDARCSGVQNRLNVITADMNDLEIEGACDRVVSCEMFEHMRNYQELLKRISGWLKPEGKLFVHIFCHRQFIYEFQTEGATNWMGQYFFSGGIMPNADIFDEFADDMRVSERWIWDGTHYQRTCNAWLELLDLHREPVMKILREAYCNQDAERWCQRWRLFLIAGAELFGFQNGKQWQVGHYLLEPVPAITMSDHPTVSP